LWRSFSKVDLSLEIDGFESKLLLIARGLNIGTSLEVAANVLLLRRERTSSVIASIKGLLLLIIGLFIRHATTPSTEVDTS
jgi:hypothetical protein